jgi:hypothetical protein
LDAFLGCPDVATAIEANFPSRSNHLHFPGKAQADRFEVPVGRTDEQVAWIGTPERLNKLLEAANEATAKTPFALPTNTFAAT